MTKNGLERWWRFYLGCSIAGVVAAIGCGGVRFLEGITDGGGIDSGGGDAALRSDAGGLDSSTDGDASAPTYCSTISPTPAFCDDFNEILSSPYGWDSSTINPAGSTLSLIPWDAAPYAPYVLSSYIPAAGGSATVVASLNQNFLSLSNGPINTLVLTFSMNISTIPIGKQSLVFAALTFQGAGGTTIIALSANYDFGLQSLSISETLIPDGGTPAVDSETTLLPGTGTWATYALALKGLTGTGATPSYSFRSDVLGSLLPSGSPTVLTTQPTQFGNVVVSLGVATNPPTNSSTILFDNVVVQTTAASLSTN